MNLWLFSGNSGIAVVAMTHQGPKGFAGKSITWVIEFFLLNRWYVWVYVFLPQAAAFWLLPAKAQQPPQAQPWLQGFLLVGQWFPGFARPFPQRQWKSSSSGRGSSKHLALRQVLKHLSPTLAKVSPGKPWDLRCQLRAEPMALLGYGKKS